jgi:thiol-disulfide isomerase/thioredoxin
MDNNLNNNADMNSTSNNTSKIIGAVIAAVVLVSGIGYLVNSQMTTQKAKDDSAMTKKNEDAAMMKKNEDAAMMKKTEGEAMMKKEGDSMTMAKAGFFGTYAPNLLTSTAGHKNILFFSATWCPTCQATNKDIQANLDKIDPKLHLLSVDYDTNQELRTKYGVTMQHTFVEVDATGNLVKKTNGLGTVSAINAYAFPIN